MSRQETGFIIRVVRDVNYARLFDRDAKVFALNEAKRSEIFVRFRYGLAIEKSIFASFSLDSV